jgi:CRP-like cAMP-binding protein
VLASDSKIRLVKNIEFFSGCSKQELEQLADLLKDAEVDEGVDVIREGDESRQFYVIVSGAADVFRHGTLVRTLGPGDFFGEVALLFHARRSATVRAASRLHLLVSEEPGFFQLIHGTRGLHKKVIDALAFRLAPTAL